MNIAHRTVPLNGMGHRLEFDYNQGLYRLAFYFPERDAMNGKQVGEQRIAIRHANLREGLQVLFAEAEGEHDEDLAYDALTVEHYMRSQPWGRELPK